jgi:hypothetical protein
VLGEVGDQADHEVPDEITRAVVGRGGRVVGGGRCGQPVVDGVVEAVEVEPAPARQLTGGQLAGKRHQRGQLCRP